jgi:hypothetical protein
VAGLISIMFQNIPTTLTTSLDLETQMTTNIEDYRKLLEAIMSEGLAKIEALSDEELRKVMDA